VNLGLRLLVYVPVLFLIAVVVVGQHHVTAAQTVREAVRRTGKWLWWTLLLVAGMLLIEVLFIGW
jgi:hypothetical protein